MRERYILYDQVYNPLCGTTRSCGNRHLYFFFRGAEARGTIFIISLAIRQCAA